MKLITSAIQKKLDANFKKVSATGESIPAVLKLFVCVGSSMTWLITDIDPNGDTMMGLCDIGMGYCEYGSISLSELKQTFGWKLERDMYFKEGTVEHFREYYEENKTLCGC